MSEPRIINPPRVSIHACVKQVLELALRTEELSARAKEVVNAGKDEVAIDGLAALGLCVQAREQLTSICQNLGFSPSKLSDFSEVAWDHASPITVQLADMLDSVAVAISRRFPVHKNDTIKSGVLMFVQDVLALTTITLSLAESRVMDCENRLRKRAA